MNTGKTIALTSRTFVSKVRSLLFSMLSRLVITFLPRSLLISLLQSPSAVILETRKIKSDTVSTVSPSICYEVMGPDAMILVFWMLSYLKCGLWINVRSWMISYLYNTVITEIKNVHLETFVESWYHNSIQVYDQWICSLEQNLSQFRCCQTCVVGPGGTASEPHIAPLSMGFSRQE